MYLFFMFLTVLCGMCRSEEECLQVNCKSGPNQAYCCRKSERTCDNIDEPCTTTDDKCVFACYCIEGYARDKHGNCIPIKDCPVLNCKVNEKYNPCPAWCTFDSDCDSYVKGWIRDCTTTPSGQVSCEPRCECIDGFVRINGTCVSANFCCLVLDAVVVNCPAECDKTCDGTDVADCDKDNCSHKTCRCVPGFVRDDKGNCIPKENCPAKCKDPNEVFNKCGPACEPTCDNRNPKSTTTACKRGCFCKKGYIRHKGKCIKLSECPPQCKPTEVMNPCPKYCTFDSDCDSYLYGIIKECSTTPAGEVPCKPRCECKPGLVRINGACVSPNLCCNDPNAEVLDCPARCEKECFAGPTDTISCVDNCKGRVCRCKKGFLLDITKKCVAPDKCIPKLTCKKYEVYNRCPKQCFPGQISYCSEYITNTPLECVRIDNYQCQPRCDCIEGYLRNKKGECVKKANCCDDPNAEALQCPARCEKECNANPTDTTSCVDNCKGIVCRCRKGFLKDVDGKCVLPEKCMKRCNGPNEHYNSCGPACEPTCEDRNPKCVSVAMCTPGCFCKQGFIRNNNGKCVCPDECCPSDYDRQTLQ